MSLLWLPSTHSSSFASGQAFWQYTCGPTYGSIPLGACRAYSVSSELMDEFASPVVASAVATLTPISPGQIVRSRFAPVKNPSLCFEVSLCLSRACLGKMIIFSIKRCKRYAFFVPSTRRVSPEPMVTPLFQPVAGAVLLKRRCCSLNECSLVFVPSLSW